MQRDIYYKCQYCVCRSRNRLKVEKHVLKCKSLALEQLYAESKLKNLLHYYSKLGYKRNLGGSMNYYIASCSCGKDSLAMVLRLIEENKPLNEIVFYDTDMEFKSIYDNWATLKLYAGRHGIKCTRLEPKCPFLYTMFEKPVNVGKPNEHKGYSWCGGCCRWGTTAKLQALDKYCQEKNAMCYVGIAADETERLIKERKSYKLFPLSDWKMTERECLEYCRNKGVTWKENGIDLYDILDRVSCWCCANKNQWELYNIWKYLPSYWDRLKELQSKNDRPFKKDYSIFDLEKRFIGGFIPKHRVRKNG